MDHGLKVGDRIELVRVTTPEGCRPMKRFRGVVTFPLPSQIRARPDGGCEGVWLKADDVQKVKG